MIFLHIIFLMLFLVPVTFEGNKNGIFPRENIFSDKKTIPLNVIKRQIWDK